MGSMGSGSRNSNRILLGGGQRWVAFAGAVTRLANGDVARCPSVTSGNLQPFLNLD
jgi:hypothetical protein